MTRRIKLIIFDLDGTLVNAYPAVEASINFTLKELGLPVQNKDKIRRAVGWGDRQLLARFVEEKKVEGSLKIYRRHHAQALKTGTRFLPGAKRLIDDLKRKKYRLALATNRPTKFSLIALKYLKIKKYFDYILCADKLKHGKPHPQILIQILKRLKTKPQEALYVGDMTIDVQTGNRAGVKTVVVLTGSCSPKEIKVLKPFRMIKRISQLTPIINEHNRNSTQSRRIDE